MVSSLAFLKRNPFNPPQKDISFCIDDIQWRDNIRESWGVSEKNFQERLDHNIYATDYIYMQIQT